MLKDAPRTVRADSHPTLTHIQFDPTKHKPTFVVYCRSAHAESAEGKLVATAAADSLPLPLPPFSSSGHTSAPMASPLAVFHPAAAASATAAARRHHPPRPPPLHLHLPLHHHHHHQPSSPRRRFAAEVLPNPCTQPSYPP